MNINHWVDVSDEAPEISGFPILFWVGESNPDNPVGCYAGYYENYNGEHPGIWFELDGRRIYGTVTHWMPYPTGPNGEIRTGQVVRDW